MSIAAIPPAPPRRKVGGFTLIELLVALAVMALLAVLGSRALDGMTRAQTMTQQRADQVLGVQTGLAQWSADLDALIQIPQLDGIDFDGRVLRLTRRDASQGDAVRVVAWSQRVSDGALRWLRWESPPLSTRGELANAWQQARTWSQTPTAASTAREIAVADIDGWQIFFFRKNAWTNPQSTSSQDTRGSPADAAAPPAGMGAPATPAVAELPDGVRLILQLSARQPLAGTITRDWVRPSLSGARS